VPEASGTDDFPDELITLIQNYKPVELKSLAEDLANTKNRLETLAVELREDRDWKREFREALQDQKTAIDKLLEGLKEEREIRQEADGSLRARLDSMSSTFGGLRVVWLLVAIILAALAGYFIPKLLGH
jgi:septal ring factor EnvC (AmiA/AmiB activator)